MSIGAHAQTIEVLRSARRLVEEPAHWIQGSLALDRYGVDRDFEDTSVECRCALGAILTASIGAGQFIRSRARQLYANAAGVGWSGIGVFNDTHTHTEVLAAFDRAIALAEERTG